MSAANTATKQTMMTSESLEERRSKELQAYKRSPELNNSKWYKGMLHSQMAGTEDNNGAFDLVLIKARPGVEPPPHLHSREHEAMYLLSGEIAFYIETEVFTAKAGEYVFIPRGKRHAFLITSEKAEVMLYVSPGGFYGAFNKMSVPAQRMEMPNGADALTYADEDLTETIKTFQQYGTRFLTPEEIRGALPEYPL